MGLGSICTNLRKIYMTKKENNLTIFHNKTQVDTEFKRKVHNLKVSFLDFTVGFISFHFLNAGLIKLG